MGRRALSLGRGLHRWLNQRPGGKKPRMHGWWPAIVLACALPGPARAQGTFTVVLDAAHGGSETGTTLAPQVLEKNLVLSLSVHLRSALAARGFRVVTTREADVNPGPESRAAIANAARAGACLLLHATASGSGVHLYTSSLGQAAAAAGLQPWASAGAPFATASLQLASEISRALESAGIPFTLGQVDLQSLDAMQCPAVALEVAPLHGSQGKRGEAAADDAGYDGRLVDALAAALLGWRGERETVR